MVNFGKWSHVHLKRIVCLLGKVYVCVCNYINFIPIFPCHCLSSVHYSISYYWEKHVNIPFVCVCVCVGLFVTPWTAAHQAPLSMEFSRVGCHFLLQGIFSTQGSKLHLLRLLHCRQVLYRLSHQRSLLIPFSSVQFSSSVMSDSLRPHVNSLTMR